MYYQNICNNFKKLPLNNIGDFMKKLIMMLLLLTTFSASAENFGGLDTLVASGINLAFKASGLVIGNTVTDRITSSDFSSGYDVNNKGIVMILGIKEGSPVCYALCRTSDSQDYSYEAFKKTQLYKELLQSLKSDQSVQALFTGYRSRNSISETANSVRSTIGKLGNFWNSEMAFNNSFTANQKLETTFRVILETELAAVSDEFKTQNRGKKNMSGYRDLVSEMSKLQ